MICVLSHIRFRKHARSKLDVTIPLYRYRNSNRLAVKRSDIVATSLLRAYLQACYGHTYRSAARFSF